MKAKANNRQVLHSLNHNTEDGKEIQGEWVVLNLYTSETRKINLTRAGIELDIFLAFFENMS